MSLIFREEIFCFFCGEYFDDSDICEGCAIWLGEMAERDGWCLGCLRDFAPGETECDGKSGPARKSYTYEELEKKYRSVPKVAFSVYTPSQAMVDSLEEKRKNGSFIPLYPPSAPILKPQPTPPSSIKKEHLSAKRKGSERKSRVGRASNAAKKVWRKVGESPTVKVP